MIICAEAVIRILRKLTATAEIFQDEFVNIRKAPRQAQKRRAVKADLLALERHGINRVGGGPLDAMARALLRLRLSNSARAVPLLLVRDEQGEWRGILPADATAEQIKRARILWNCESAKRARAAKRKRAARA